MKVELLQTSGLELREGINAYVIFAQEKLPPALEEYTKGLKKERFEGKLGQTAYFETVTSKAKVLLIGVGAKVDFKTDYIRRAAGIATRYSSAIKEKEFSFHLNNLDQKSYSEFTTAITEGTILASYKSTEFKSKKDDIFFVEKMTIVCSDSLLSTIEKAAIYANAQNYARELDEKPANIATPSMMANEAKKVAKQFGFDCTVFGKKELEKMGMGATIGVCQGSVHEPQMIKLEYNKNKKELPLYCIVGKGVTFDTGGISLKPSKNMHEMKYDKTGAVNVLAVFRAVSQLKLPIRLLGMMAMVENMPGANAQKPGDIVRSYNGKTIEVLNTDAEGRLILADALSYAAEQKPEFIIDMATLTGAIIVSLGRFAMGMFSNDDKLSATISQAGDETFERVWRMPLWPEYGELMKSDFADLKNISELDEAGSITAAGFLKEFIGECKWAHLDIAAVDMVKWPHSYLEKGASGTGVRLLIKVLENMSTRK